MDSSTCLRFCFFLTEYSPSVVLASLMLCIWGIGHVCFYKSFTLNAVFAAAFFMLIFNPLYLFNVGFQLSFIAVVSILLINPYLIQLYRTKNVFVRYFWNLSCIYASAQAGVLPVSVFYFRQFPVIFLLTNWYLIPLATILLCLNFGDHVFAYAICKMLMTSFIYTTQKLNSFLYTNIYQP